MLRRLVFVPAATLVRASRPTYWPVAAPSIVLFSTTSRPPEDTQTPPPGRVAGPGDSNSTGNFQGKPPDTTHTRLTGDEVEEAFDPLGNVGRRMGEAVKGAASTVKEVLIDREDPIVAAGEEAYHSVPKYQETIDLTAQRAKEKLQGHVWPEGKEGAKIEIPREARKEGGGEGGILEGVKETVKQTLQEGVEKLKGGVEAATEAIRREGARHEEEMQAAAEEQRKKVMKKQRGEEVEEEGGREGKKGSMDKKRKQKKEGHAESILGAPVGPKE